MPALTTSAEIDVEIGVQDILVLQAPLFVKGCNPPGIYWEGFFMPEETMNPNNSRCALSVFVLLIAIVACASPSQPIQPVPTLNPFAIDTAVAGTAQAAQQQTQQANPVPATETPAPTATITPTPKISLAGTSLVMQEDQSTLFIDHKVGFQLIVPAGWLATRINEEEYFKAFALDVVAANPPINDRLRHMQTSNADYLRLDAVDIRPGHVVNGMISDIAVIFQPPEMAQTLEEWLKLEKQAVSASMFVGHKILSSKFQQTTTGIKTLVIEESWALNQEEKVYAKRVFFSLPSGTITVDLQTHMDFKDTVLPEHEQVVNSVTLSNP